MESPQSSSHGPSHAGQAEESGTTTDSESAARLCSDLQALISSTDADTRRQHLRESLGRLGAAGVGCFRFEPGVPTRSSTRPEWLEDLSGELQAVPVDDVWNDVNDATPLWLHRWLLLRQKPFWLSRYIRYIPFSARWLLKASGPAGSLPLADLIVVTQMREPPFEGLVVGLHAQASPLRAEQIITLASAFLLVRQAEPRSAVNPTPLVLSERRIECLRWLVAGKSVKGVAAETGLSYANVRYHIERAKKQTGVSSLQQLIAIGAVQYGLSPQGPTAPES